MRGIGEEVGPDAPFAIVHAATDSDAAAAAELLRRAVERGRNPFRHHSADHRRACHRACLKKLKVAPGSDPGLTVMAARFMISVVQ